MNKKIYKSVKERANGSCEECGQYMGDMLELHHILRRKVPETIENCIMLCKSCHTGTDGVHGKNGHTLDVKLKQRVQQAYMDKGLDIGTVRFLMGGRLIA